MRGFQLVPPLEAVFRVRMARNGDRLVHVQNYVKCLRIWPGIFSWNSAANEKILNKKAPFTDCLVSTNPPSSSKTIYSWNGFTDHAIAVSFAVTSFHYTKNGIHYENDIMTWLFTDLKRYYAQTPSKKLQSLLWIYIKIKATVCYNVISQNVLSHTKSYRYTYFQCQ